MSKLIFVTEARFIKGKDNRVYGDAAFKYSLWQRYLASFDEVYIMARVKKDVNYVSDKKYISSGDGVTFIELPYYVGALGFLKKYFALKKKIKKEIQNLSRCKFLCRIPGNISNLVIDELLAQNRKYALEVVGDPDDVFAPGTINHPFRAYFRKTSILSLRKNIQMAGAVLYVTKNTLQKKYPPDSQAYNTFASNVKLESEFIPNNPKSWEDKKNIQIVSIGSLEQMYKAPDILVESIKLLNDRNDISFNLKWLGDGLYIKNIIQLAHNFEIRDKIEIVGNVDKEEVYDYLNNSDLFVLASRTEGLPRAVIEAMSVGLPIVGTNVGGIPELLESKVLVEKNNAKELADKIFSIVTNKKLYEEQAKRNFKESKLYSEGILNKKRTEFYNYINENL